MTVSDRIVEEVIAFVKDKALNDSSLKDRIDALVRESQTAASSKVQNDPADWVFNFIRVEGKPQPTDEIVDAMRDAGMPVSGENPSRTLNERLLRDNRLKHVPDEGWAIKEGGAIKTPYAAPYANGSVKEISDETANRFAKSFVEKLDAANIGTLNHHISIKGVGLPYSVDIEMLRRFKETYKRLATETEKQLLRNSILKEMARD